MGFRIGSLYTPVVDSCQCMAKPIQYCKVKKKKKKTMGCFSGCLMSSASIQKLFCGVCSALKCSFDEFVREKVVFPSYSSTILARTWKQPRCPSADEWIRKLWYIHIMEYYSAIKKNTCESVLMRWMKLEPIIQSEESQKEKHQYSILTNIYGI